VAAEPVLILEVLSPSTERIDTIVKLDEYKALASVMHILIAEPDTPHVLLYSRDENGHWVGLDHIGADTELNLPAIGCTLPIAALYEGLL
jgi:Uma2 family endonuclease